MIQIDKPLLCSAELLLGILIVEIPVFVFTNDICLFKLFDSIRLISLFYLIKKKIQKLKRRMNIDFLLYFIYKAFIFEYKLCLSLYV